MYTQGFGHAWVPRARLDSSSSLVSNPQILHLSALRIPTHPSHSRRPSSHHSFSFTDLSLLYSEVSWISLAMAHILTVVLSTSLALVIVVSAPVRFAET